MTNTWTPSPDWLTGIYTLTPADLGSRVTVILTGSLKGYADTIMEAQTSGAAVLPTRPAASMPVVTGNAVVGSVLTATWKAAPKAATYTWFRNYMPIRGATAATYKLTAADKGSVIMAVAKVKVPGSSWPTEMPGRGSSSADPSGKGQLCNGLLRNWPFLMPGARSSGVRRDS
ncbi:hypothetical protein [Arthrobacter sp. Leaf69]|uniref:hypothetical protein n=1 Tax=Arthrobacter sp. Leaf69 TaxID=1736232 RepID=UPI0012E2209B|nr:hypothetical protein [Arthrobacter sp. Leaf69]